MRINKIIIVAVLFSLYLYTDCSKLDQYTDTGTEIVESINPMLIDFDKKFRSVNLDSHIVAERFSLPDSAMSGFGRHTGYLAAGSDEVVIVYGYTQFTITRSFAGKFDSADIFDSVTLFFDTIADTIYKSVIADSGEVFRLYGCTKENRYALSVLGSTDKPAGILVRVEEGKPRFGTALLDSSLADSVFRMCRGYKKCVDSCTDDTCRCDSVFVFSLFGSGKGITFFGPEPLMVIHSHRKKIIDGKDSAVDRSDTLKGLSGMVVNEVDTVVAKLTPKSISDWLTQRTAVFKIDMSELWEEMLSSSFGELLSAAFIFERRHQTTEGIDSTPTVIYFLSERLISDVNDLEDEFENARKRYSPVVNLKAGGADTLILPVDYHLQNFMEEKYRYFYLYLRITSIEQYGKQEIVWSLPRFKAVLTTIGNGNRSE